MNLQKMKKAETWPAALHGRNARVDPLTLEGMQKKIMLERFQSEVHMVHACRWFLWPYVLTLSQRRECYAAGGAGAIDHLRLLLFASSTI